MRGVRRVPGGFITGAFTDHHVHVQLIDPSGLAGSVLGRVIDLGGNPEVLAAAATSPEWDERGVEIAFAGAFLTPPGGYPSDRSWAPTGSVREIADADAAARAVAEMKDAGASCIKVAGNSTAGPVFTDELFREIVRLSAASGMPVVAHAEGAGEAQRVVRMGATRLAHAPFTERLTEPEIDLQAESAEWVSTLAIHGDEAYEIAVDNVRRFYEAGGTVLYGTDMGNGSTPAGLNPHEIAALREAGIDGEDLLRALAPLTGEPWLFLPGDAFDPLLARPLTPADLEA
ncbi:amidohydrolase family protein [Microbacterium abyssi]|uniref:amidohydrolase family protein n=1 Tax=Microbacterium abyssi TaxID=2782166 RepID=UPI001E4575AB|nr:hydrolase [Microbacterium sp. A18JL241]